MPVESEEVIEAGKSYGADTDAILASLANSEEKWKISNFQTSPLMSTYLVAFANGPFEYLETSVVMPLSGKTIPLRIYSTYNSLAFESHSHLNAYSHERLDWSSSICS